jgi:hypothetical protein
MPTHTVHSTTPSSGVKTTRVSINTNRYIQLVDSINSSGYWQLPFYFVCDNIPTEVGSLILKANTPIKYNVAEALDCFYKDARFTKAFQQLINSADLKR